jgi:hypothetical protein
VEEVFSEVRLASGAHIWSLMSTMAKLAPAKMTASKPKTGARGVVSFRLTPRPYRKRE